MGRRNSVTFHCIPWFGSEYVSHKHTEPHTCTCTHTSVTDLSNSEQQSPSNLANIMCTRAFQGALWSVIIPEHRASHCSQ